MCSYKKQTENFKKKLTIILYRKGNNNRKEKITECREVLRFYECLDLAGVIIFWL